MPRAATVQKSEENWPASKVELWEVDRIKPYKKNPRQHSQAQIDLIADSMKTDGVIAPILVDEKGVIIYGHGRRLAAIKNDFKTYPVCVAIGWTEERKRAVRIKDNQFGELSEWDMPMLRLEASDLKLQGYDLQLLGFSEPMTMWLTTGELVENTGAEWGGMPQFQQDDKTAFRSIVVHFKDQESVDAFAKVTKQKINEKTRFLWYPEIEIKPFIKVASK